MHETNLEHLEGHRLEEIDFFSIPWLIEPPQTNAYRAFPRIREFASPVGFVSGRSVLKEYCHVPLSFRGIKLDLYGKKERISRNGAEDVIVQEYYSFLFSLGDATLKCVFVIRPQTNEITTSILKEDPDKTLPAGLGIIVYQKMIDSIQTFVDREEKPMTHVVDRYPQISTRPLSIERWNELFLPLLNQKGREYTPDPDYPDKLSRTFVPKK